MENITCITLYGKKKKLPQSAYYFRPSVYAFIVHDGSIVTVRMKSTGKYAFPGGGVEDEGDNELALHREVREEAGIEIYIEKFVYFRENYFYYNPTDEAINGYMYFYLCRAKSYDLAKDGEVDDYEAESPAWTKITDITEENIQGPEIGVLPILKQLV
jgi:8-oxo-dGTP pyrophosphatase MutT (NUDIX family)